MGEELSTTGALPRPESSDETQEQFDAAEVFTYNEERYYKSKGHQYPSVTTILSPFTPQHAKDPAAAERGRIVHRALELYDRGELDYRTIPQSLHGYLQAWEHFLFETGAKVVEVEQTIIDPTYGYAGRRDRILVNVIPGMANTKVLVDLKTGAINFPLALQTAAYTTERNIDTWARAGLQLRSDGTYRWNRFPMESNRRHFVAFANLCNMHHLRQRGFPW